MFIYSIHKLTNVKRLTYNPNHTLANKILIYTLANKILIYIVADTIYKLTEDPVVTGQGALLVWLPQSIKPYLLWTQN